MGGGFQEREGVCGQDVGRFCVGWGNDRKRCVSLKVISECGDMEAASDCSSPDSSCLGFSRVALFTLGTTQEDGALTER